MAPVAELKSTPLYLDVSLFMALTAIFFSCGDQASRGMYLVFHA